MTNSEDTLIFSVEGKEYTVQMSVLERQSSMSLGFWLDELIDASQHGISQPEVDAFLAAVIGRNFHAVYTANFTRITDWYAVLRLSTRWSFNALRDRAIICLDTALPPSEKIVLAKAHDVPQWLVPAYTALALRDDPLSLAEVRRLDPQDVVLVTSARENILRQQLSNDETAVTSHFSRALHILSAEPAERDDLVAKTLSEIPVPSLFPTGNSTGIIVSCSVPGSVSAAAPSQMSSSRDALPFAGVDISFFTAGRYDDAVELVTPDVADNIVRALFASSVIVSATAQKPYDHPAALIALAALRRGARDAPFLQIGPRFIRSIFQISAHAESTFAGALQSLNARYADFKRSPEKVPKRDKYIIMPPSSSLTPSAYGTCMKNVQGFVTVLLKRDCLRDYKWIRQLRPLCTESSSLPDDILAPHAPIGGSATLVVTQSQINPETTPNDYVIVPDDPDIPSPSVQTHLSAETNATASDPDTARAGLKGLIPVDEPAIIPDSVQSPIDLAVAALLAGDYDAGVYQLTPDNAAIVSPKLFEHASFQLSLPEPAQGDHRTAPVSQLARAILRRAFRDPYFAFVPVGTDLLAQITNGVPWLSRDLNGTLRALLNRWKEFQNANGDCSLVRVDAGRYMSDEPPSSIGTQVYRERMERGREVVRAVAEKKAFVGWEAATRATARRAAEFV